jgi:hypothetical protein
MFVDLHIHTTASDGLFTPPKLLKESEEAKLKVISITDHDSVDNIPEILKVFNDSQTRVIPGVELSTVWEGRDVHFLGYYIDWTYKPLSDTLHQLRDGRIERMEKIVKKMNEEGFKVSLDEVLEATHGGAAGRSHLARVLLKKGYVSSINEAFELYLARGKPFYVEKFTLSPKEAISLISESGGIPVLAHPGVAQTFEFLDLFLKWGVRGVEVYYPDHTPEEVEHFLSLSREKGLLVSGGSDAHGLPGRGEHLGEFKVSSENVKELLEISESIPT